MTSKPESFPIQLNSTIQLAKRIGTDGYDNAQLGPVFERKCRFETNVEIENKNGKVRRNVIHQVYTYGDDIDGQTYIWPPDADWSDESEAKRFQVTEKAQTPMGDGTIVQGELR